MKRLSPILEHALAAMNTRSMAELEQVNLLAAAGFYGVADTAPEQAKSDVLTAFQRAAWDD